MPKPTKGPRLGGSSSHQKALLANLAASKAPGTAGSGLLVIRMQRLTTSSQYTGFNCQRALTPRPRAVPVSTVVASRGSFWLNTAGTDKTDRPTTPTRA